MTQGAADLFTTSAMAAAFAPEAHVVAMLAFESALARAEARVGVIPAEAAEAIGAACRVDLYDVAAVWREAAAAGTPAIPLVRMLTEQVIGAGKGYVHWGATSQDAMDSAMMLQARAGLDLLNGDLLRLGAACADLAERYRHTPMAGRTLLQQALPITFGLKAARWLALVTRQARALRDCRVRCLALQFAGAAGTLASLKDDGLEVAALLAEELGLPMTDLPWHAERDRVAAMASSLGVVAGAMAKIAADLILLAQTEVGEVMEAAAPGKGVSSAMPQKRNPVDAVLATSSARLALGLVPVILNSMANEHERAAGGWQAEWVAIPMLFGYTAGAVSHVTRAVDGLQVDAARMAANIERGGGLLMAEALTMALARRVGRPDAMRLVREASQRAAETGASLGATALEDASISERLSRDEIQRALDPREYLGSTDAFIDRALTGFQNWRAAEP